MSIIRCRQRAPNHYGGTAMSWNLAQACTYIRNKMCLLPSAALLATVPRSCSALSAFVRRWVAWQRERSLVSSSA